MTDTSAKKQWGGRCLTWWQCHWLCYTLFYQITDLSEY